MTWSSLNETGMWKKRQSIILYTKTNKSKGTTKSLLPFIPLQNEEAGLKNMQSFQVYSRGQQELLVKMKRRLSNQKDEVVNRRGNKINNGFQPFGCSRDQMSSYYNLSNFQSQRSRQRLERVDTQFDYHENKRN